MSSLKESPNLIRSEQLEECQVWSLPDVGDGRAVHTAGYMEESEEDVGPLTAEELEKIRQEGYKDGHAEGLKKGEQEGLQKGSKKAQAEIQKKVAEVAKALKQLAKPLASQENDIEDAIADLVVEVSRAVVRRELLLDSEQVLYAVREAIDALPIGCKNMKIFCHSKDQETIQKAADESGEVWLIVTDDTMAAGGCRIETENSIVDFTSEQMFHQVIAKALDKNLDDIDLINHPDGMQPDLFGNGSSMAQVANGSSKPFPTADDFPDLSLIRRPSDKD